MKFNCNICKKDYKSYHSLWKHNYIYHKNEHIRINDNKTRNFECEYCNKKFTTKQSAQIHTENSCKQKEIIKKQLEQLENESKKQLAQLENDAKKQKQLENTNIINNLMEKLIVKDTQIQNLKDNVETGAKTDTEFKTNINTNFKQNYKEFAVLWNDNNHKILVKDNKFINGEQLCNIANLSFNDWFSLDSTQELVNEMGLKIEKSDGIYWINFDVALMISQWISNKFMLLINNLIINHIIDQHNNTIKLKENEIKVLKDNFLKKQSRENFPNNCIYIVTSNENKLKRTYIIGKATSLKDRLSSYNKSSEHTVVYYKHCPDKESTKIIESVVLKKLEKYKEKANRDRFILPADQNINLFIKTIDESINFLTNTS